MIALDLSNKVRELIAADIPIESLSSDRIVVYMPFMYDDGDHLSIYIDNKNGAWSLSDEGDVLKRTSESGLNFGRPENADRLKNLIEFYGVTESNGALNISADDEMLADSIFTLTQTCLEATWLAKTPKAAARTEGQRFPIKLERLVTSAISAERLKHNWHDPVFDPERIYPVDYRIDSSVRQLFLFGVTNVPSCMRATITCLHYEKVGANFSAVAVYDDEGALPVRYAKQLNEVVDTRFPRINESRQIKNFLKAVAA